MDARLAIVPLVVMVAFGASYMLIIVLSATSPDDGNDVADGSEHGCGLKKVDGDTELQSLFERMWLADEDDRASASDIQLDWGKHIVVGDHGDGLTEKGNRSTSGTRLFTSVNESLFEQNPLYSSLISIYNDGLFNASACTKEPLLRGERLAKLLSHFELLTNTTVFQHVFDYLVSRRIVLDEFDAFYSQLFQLWFGTYSRCTATSKSNGRSERKLGSSGWERVFVGEIQDEEGDSPARVEGLHNWVRFYLLEKAGEITYNGYLNRTTDNEDEDHDGLVAGSFRYEWRGKHYSSKTFLIGPSPAFDFALYTVCALAHPGVEGCEFQLDGRQRLYVNSEFTRCDKRRGTHSARVIGARCISTVYPSFPIV